MQMRGTVNKNMCSMIFFLGKQNCFGNEETKYCTDTFVLC
jgi:hypothetical protein